MNKELHQQLVRPAHDGMLYFLQLVLHAVESVDALFEMIRQALEQRRHLRIFETVELRNDVVTFLPGLHPVNEALQAMASQPEMIDALRKHPGEKQSVVADVLPHLPLAIEGQRRAKYWIRFHQHFADISERLPNSVVNLEELFRVAELG